MRLQLNGTVHDRGIEDDKSRNCFTLLTQFRLQFVRTNSAARHLLTPTTPLKSVKDFHTCRTAIHANATSLCTSLYQELPSEATKFPGRDNSVLGMCFWKPECKNFLQMQKSSSFFFLNDVIYQFLPHKRISVQDQTNKKTHILM